MASTRTWFETVAEAQRRARRRLPRSVYLAVLAGTEAGVTMHDNVRAFSELRFRPHVAGLPAARELATTVMGLQVSLPVLISPTGVQAVHPDGEVAVARAAAATGVPMILSTAASSTIEEVGQANGDGERWFQLYWPKDRAVAASFLARAKTAGFSVLVLTLDTRLLGYRPRDLERGYLPFLRGIGNQNYFCDPAFAAALPGPAGEHQDAAILHWVQIFGDASLTWDDLPFLRDHWDGPIVLKGIQSVADAERAADAGMDGIVVSNHGGRQVDGGIAALDALPPIASAIGSRLTVLFDSGIRSGADVVKALALGARAVLIARPYAYALGLAGEEGVRHVVRALRQDFELTMRLAGHANLAGLTADSLARVP